MIVKENINILKPRDEEDIEQDKYELIEAVKDKLEHSARPDLWQFIDEFFNRFEDDRENTQLEDYIYYNISHKALRELALDLLKNRDDYGFEDEENLPFLKKYLNED